MHLARFDGLFLVGLSLVGLLSNLQEDAHVTKDEDHEGDEEVDDGDEGEEGFTLDGRPLPEDGLTQRHVVEATRGLVKVSPE